MLKAALAGASAVLAALAVLAVSSAGLDLRPGTAAWSRLVVGPADGSIGSGLVIRAPGLARVAGEPLLIEAPPGTTLSVAIDRGPFQPLRIAQAAALALPPHAVPGLRLELRADAATSRIEALRLRRGRATPWLPALLAFAAVLALVRFPPLVRRVAPGGRLVLGLLAAGLLGLAFMPAYLALSLPDASAVARVLPSLALVIAAVLAWRRLPAPERGIAGRLALVLVAVVFGAWVRVVFLPSPGSWDTEYWKAWMLRTVSHGVTGVYGDAGAVPAGHLVPQLRGQEELFKVRAFNRDFVVDYPPLAMALWRGSWWAVTHAAREMDSAEAQNAAVKLPSVLGDAAAAVILFLAFPHRRFRGLALAALYWALPVSWYASAVLGYLDGAYAPLAAAAVLFAGRGKPGASGLCLALACLVKPTAVVIAPALVVALLARRASLVRAVAAGLCTVAVVLVPFVLAGTLTTAIVHVYRILFQGTLSGGFANPWWVVGHLVHGGGAGPVSYARLDSLSFDPRPIGSLLFAAAAAFVGLRQRGQAGAPAAALAAGALVFAYGIFAIGVHDNHPYPMVLLLCLSGLATRRIAALGAALSVTLVLNSLALSGIGRLGSRHEMLEPFARSVAGLRMALGFDLTLGLCAVHTLLFALLLAWIGAEMRASSE